VCAARNAREVPEGRDRGTGDARHRGRQQHGACPQQNPQRPVHTLAPCSMTEIYAEGANPDSTTPGARGKIR
jgi:hypothetical protein